MDVPRNDSMGDITRAIVFLVPCLGARVVLAWMGFRYSANDPIRLSLSVFAIVAAAGWSTLWWNGWRKVWWDDLRPLHAMMYAGFALASLSKKTYAWTFLAADVALGAAAWFYFKSHVVFK